MKPIWRLTVRDEFCAAHALRHYRGKCENTHGHNFSVEIDVEGSELDPATGMLLDFGILKKSLKQALAELDHQLLNDMRPFDTINPSSENIGRHIWERMGALLAECPDPQATKVRIVRVEVGEKSTQSATYLGLRDF